MLPDVGETAGPNARRPSPGLPSCVPASGVQGLGSHGHAHPSRHAPALGRSWETAPLRAHCGVGKEGTSAEHRAPCRAGGDKGQRHPSSFGHPTGPPDLLGLHCPLAGPDRRGPGRPAATPSRVSGFLTSSRGLNALTRRDPWWPQAALPTASMRHGSTERACVEWPERTARLAASCSGPIFIQEIKIPKAPGHLSIRQGAHPSCFSHTWRGRRGPASAPACFRPLSSTRACSGRPPPQALRNCGPGGRPTPLPPRAGGLWP